MKSSVKERAGDVLKAGQSFLKQGVQWLFNQKVLLDIGQSFNKQASKTKEDDQKSALLIKSAVFTVASTPLVRNLLGVPAQDDSDED